MPEGFPKQKPESEKKKPAKRTRAVTVEVKKPKAKESKPVLAEAPEVAPPVVIEPSPFEKLLALRLSKESQEVIPQPPKEMPRRNLEEVPEVIAGVRFEPKRNRSGAITRIRSSAPGRKEIVLREDPKAELANAIRDFEKTYRVKIVEDTNPEDPLRGSYVAEIIEDVVEAVEADIAPVEAPESELKHTEAHKSRVEHLRRSEEFQALAEMLQDPELRQEYDAVMSRRKELLKLQEGDERHRSLAPLAVGLMMGKRTGPLFDMVIDESVERRSKELKETIETASEVPYVPEIVIGAGLQGSIYSLTRQMVAPENPSATFDADRRIGGQFAQMESPLFRINNRVRPDVRGVPATPGTAANLSTMTEWAVTSPADTTGEAYPDQLSYGKHARLNMFLSGEPITEAEVRNIRKIDYDDGPRYKVEVLDTGTGKVFELETSRAVYTTGLMKENPQLDFSDETTAKIFKEEQRKYREGDDAQVMSFGEVTKRLANPSNPFPLRGYKRLVVSGKGDSGNVLVGMFLGYEGQRNLSTTQLDHVEEITWIGQDLVTKEQFVEECRTRYHQIGLEFPRRAAEEYYSRIVPVPDVRVSNLARRKNGDIEVIDFNGDRYSGDHFIYAHGFRNTVRDTLNFFEPRVYEDRNDIADYLGNNDDLRLLDLDLPLCISLTPETGLKRVEFRDTDGPEGTNNETFIELVQIDTEGNLTTQYISGSTSLQEYLRTVIRKENIEEEITKIEREDEYRNFVEFTPTSVDPIAERYDFEEIYLAGATAELSVTDRERSQSAALRTVPENSAANFRYAQKTADLAKFLALEDREKASQTTIFDLARGKAKNLERSTPPKLEMVMEPDKDMRKKVPFDMPLTDLMRFGIGTAFEDYEFDFNGEQSLTVTVTADTKGAKKTPVWKVTSAQLLPGALFSKLERALQGYAGVAVERAMGDDTGSRKKSAVRITIPFDTRRQAKIADISYAAVRA